MACSQDPSYAMSAELATMNSELIELMRRSSGDDRTLLAYGALWTAWLFNQTLTHELGMKGAKDSFFPAYTSDMSSHFAEQETTSWNDDRDSFQILISSDDDDSVELHPEVCEALACPSDYGEDWISDSFLYHASFGDSNEVDGNHDANISPYTFDDHKQATTGSLDYTASSVPVTKYIQAKVLYGGIRGLCRHLKQKCFEMV
ncbi:hypothetical protein M406DRAFT_74116 [Cryphonectria parasitica EP155]|uniref:Uncharacterized protein n=1 Tax=Cryphonectria parasitica (strain ATCC 38755 / EP155) TaxID=660469 RepID=A0A9P5CMX0_CRYP1|nr:uncharacterized protein M406DRAFT_74116 [Cryphonectria parasitica EP155]KAF3763521.1 hypothetical protein M406DRAFT_74116 [Cryphonectria parasitica EP155]